MNFILRVADQFADAPRRERGLMHWLQVTPWGGGQSSENSDMGGAGNGGMMGGSGYGPGSAGSGATWASRAMCRARWKKWRAAT